MLEDHHSITVQHRVPEKTTHNSWTYIFILLLEEAKSKSMQKGQSRDLSLLSRETFLIERNSANSCHRTVAEQCNIKKIINNYAERGKLVVYYDQVRV